MAEQSSLTIPLTEISKRIHVPTDVIAEVVREEVRGNVPNDLRAVPGGRLFGGVPVVYRGMFEVVTRGDRCGASSPCESSSCVWPDARRRALTVMTSDAMEVVEPGVMPIGSAPAAVCTQPTAPMAGAD